MTICIRWMFDANMATITRPFACSNCFSKVVPTLRSLMVWPARSTLVDSHSRAMTPFSPRAARVWRSMISPSMGV